MEKRQMSAPCHRCRFLAFRLCTLPGLRQPRQQPPPDGGFFVRLAPHTARQGDPIAFARLHLSPRRILARRIGILATSDSRRKPVRKFYATSMLTYTYNILTVHCRQKSGERPATKKPPGAADN